MKIVSVVEEMKHISRSIHDKNKSIGFVPTMGALHDGHLSLIKEAVKFNDYVVVSIFINPIQFDKKKDLQAYPTNKLRDHEIAKKIGVSVLFEPTVNEMYPAGLCTFVDTEGLPLNLCGGARSGHFRGVSTVVVKLFNIVKPEIAYFGEKDFQQSVIVTRLVKDLDMEVKIAVLPTVRANDGLALSSRNMRLNGVERSDALCLFEAIKNTKMLVESGVTDAASIKKSCLRIINVKKSVKKVDYVSVVNRDTLLDVPYVDESALLAMAIWVGETRLIDNCSFEECFVKGKTI